MGPMAKRSSCAPGGRTRGRGLEAEDGDHPPTRRQHADRPRKADDQGHHRRAEGQPDGTDRRADVAEEQGRHHQGHRGQQHHDGGGRDEGDEHRLEHAEGQRIPRAPRGVPPRLRMPRPDRRRSRRPRARPRPARRVRVRSSGPGRRAPRGRRRRRRGHPTGRGPGRCRAAAWPGRRVRRRGTARCEPNGRSSRTAPQAPRGRQAKTSTFWVRPMAPSRTRADHAGDRQRRAPPGPWCPPRTGATRRRTGRTSTTRTGTA